MIDRGPAATFAAVKRLATLCLALLMLVGSLIPQNDLRELAKLPQLLEHYADHQTPAGGGLSFRAFLALHYGAGSDHYARRHASHHEQDHHDLPLRCHHDCPVVVFVMPVPPAPSPVGLPEIPALDYRAPAVPLYAFAFSNPLLEPPRA